MCNIYTCKMTAAEMRALYLHYKFIGTTWTAWEERQCQQNEPVENVYPNQRAPVVVLQDDEHIVREDMLWGFPRYGRAYGTNFRKFKNPRYRPWLNRVHRCVVPAMAFAEPDRNAPTTAMMRRWFKRADGLPFCFAGIWRPWTGDRGTKKAPDIGDHTLFSILTTEPNSVRQRVHEQPMPVMLMTAEDVDRWLKGNSVEDAVAMQKPALDSALVVVQF